MLKVIFTETGQHLELLTSSLANWLDCQKQLATQAGYTLHLESCTASILLPANEGAIATLERIIAKDDTGTLVWEQVDAYDIEVVFTGVWVAPHAHEHEGAFIVGVGDRTALALFQLWVHANQHISALSR